jgi:hypothetical protein
MKLIAKNEPKQIIICFEFLFFQVNYASKARFLSLKAVKFLRKAKHCHFEPFYAYIKC